MILTITAIIAGFVILLWSANLFVDAAASAATHFGMPPLLIGMVIVGFGTSAPEMLVSALAASQGSPGIALGNAYGSNIANIALILGITALISPIIVKSTVLRKELPILTLITALSFFLLSDLDLSFSDSIILLAVFAGLMGWTIYQGTRRKTDPLAAEVADSATITPLGRSMIRLLAGLILLLFSSRILVWGAVELALFFKVSNMVIGLTIVAIGTSLPELAASVIAARKGEHEIAIGNVIGSNLFNTLAVVGIAGMIHPFQLEPVTLSRDMLLMFILTLSLFIICYGFKGKQGQINRFEGAGLLIAYIGYTAWLIKSVISVS